ncbi:MAG TPA: sodium-dependent transporter [Candidatus Eubacterium faecigallinarum]|nr:sodium-dependent transporter [Candidatus Eubacterium faecigallinarum]
MSEKKRSSFTGSIGFVLAAAGSAVGLGNIWRFPYLAAKDNGGLFLLCYLVLVVTFGFALLTTEIAIGRKTKQSPLTAYSKINKKMGGIGSIATLVPVIILPYYCCIGGWVLKYFFTFLTGQGQVAATDGYFTSYISEQWQPIIWFVVYLVITSLTVFCGVNKGIEKMSKILMPILLILIMGISIYSLTLSYTDASGVTRTGLEGLKIYIIPNFSDITIKDFFVTLMDAMGQLFFSISVAMGIMVAYGSYVADDTNLIKSINQIEIFDTVVAFLAGLMIVPSVYVFMGTEGMSAGPGLMFVSLPKIFNAMGEFGEIIGALFFLMVIFAAITSSVSIMEPIVASFMDRFHLSRKKAVIIVTVYALVFGTLICLGYNLLYFEVKLPNGSVGQLLDVFDYISNNILMPIVAILTCILIGWVAKPKTIIDEVTKNGEKFRRKNLYIVMIKFLAPVLLFALLLQALGVF